MGDQNGDFGYERASIVQQTTENQRLELQTAGSKIDYRFSDHGVSGKACASQRPQFALLLNRIRDGESIIVTKLDRLGRDSIDVLQTVRLLGERNIQVIVLQLGSVDLTSATVKMLAAVASMERDLLIGRSPSGLARAGCGDKRNQKFNSVCASTATTALPSVPARCNCWSALPRPAASRPPPGNWTCPTGALGS